MKTPTITFIDSKQVSEDRWIPYTKVIHISMDETIREIYEKHFSEWAKGADVELHIPNQK